jgi:hypothetical protein
MPTPTILKSLIPILDIQELDMKMIQLMRLKHQRVQELDKIKGLKDSLRSQAHEKKLEIHLLKSEVAYLEEEVAAIQAKIKKLEGQQAAIRKVEEFNALSHEMTQTEKERTAKELKLSDLIDKIATAEDGLKVAEEALAACIENSKALEAEIVEGITRINDEGKILKAQRDELATDVDGEIFKIYERLLKNKQDRVIVPIENRCCSGCHIMLTAQDENLVRKGERLIFCEHCSRIHFWQESQALEGSTVATKTRRRKAVKATN